MPKGKTEKTGEQRALDDAEKLAKTFAARMSKKLDAVPSATATKDLRANLRSFQGAATKQLSALQKDAKTRGPQAAKVKKPTKSKGKSKGC